MTLRRLLPGLILCGLLSAAGARTVRLTLWVSGGSNGVLLGGDPAPGWLGVAEHIRNQPDEGAWIDAGGTFDWSCLSSIPRLRLPDAMVPGEETLRLRGVGALEDVGSWTLLNAAVLPQFPESELSAATSRVWRQEDGVGWRMLGLLSDKAPLRVPPERLRPLRVTDALETLRSFLLKHSAEGSTATALVVPEGEDPAEWSRRTPDIPVLIEPAGTWPDIVAAHGGRQIRVRPARFGRAVIRVWMNWDTVERRFGDPKAEVEWVRTPDLEKLELPDCAERRLRPLVDPPESDPETALLSRADLVLLPTETGDPAESTLIDALRVAAAPVDHAWLRVEVAAATLEAWRDLDLPGFAWRGDAASSGTRTVLMPDVAAAGAGGAARPVREALDGGGFEPVWMEFTTRDLAVPLPEERP